MDLRVNQEATEEQKAEILRNQLQQKGFRIKKIGKNKLLSEGVYFDRDIFFGVCLRLEICEVYLNREMQ